MLLLPCWMGCCSSPTSCEEPRKCRSGLPSLPRSCSGLSSPSGACCSRRRCLQCYSQLVCRLLLEKKKHNGEWELAQLLARKTIEQIPPEQFDAIITNVGGYGSHCKHYAKLLPVDPA